jgi:hypothetical protein
MKRFFGMMPSDEIKKEKHYKDDLGLRITIQAGPHGWTIMYADSSSEFKDVDSTTNENFKTAYDIATKNLGKLIEI